MGALSILFDESQHLVMLKQRDSLPGCRRIDCQHILH